MPSELMKAELRKQIEELKVQLEAARQKADGLDNEDLQLKCTIVNRRIKY